MFRLVGALCFLFVCVVVYGVSGVSGGSVFYWVSGFLYVAGFVLMC